MKKVFGLFIAGVVIASGITACGNNSDSGNQTDVATVEQESIPDQEASEETSEEVSEDNFAAQELSIPGIWQTVSIGYVDADSMQPEYYVRFTDSEIQYGHMKEGEFSLEYSDKISTIEVTTGGGFRVQAENANGVKYTYQTSEDDSMLLEYYGTWDENEFAENYSGSSSLTSCEEKEEDGDQESFNTEQTKNPKVFVDYFDVVKDLYPDYVDASEMMKGNSAEYETVVLFHTDGKVEDFRVFSLELNVDENGGVDFIPTEVFRLAELKQDAPIAVPLNFPGDMSLNGFCYKGPDGNVNTFTVGISGEDGSLLINAENFAVPES